MAAETIYCGRPGSLPFTINYTPKSTDRVVIQIQGSVYSKSDGMVGLNCYIDGPLVGTSSIWSNGAYIHRNASPLNLNYNFDSKNVINGTPVPIKVELQNSTTVFDENDFVTVTIFD